MKASVFTVLALLCACSQEPGSDADADADAGAAPESAAESAAIVAAGLADESRPDASPATTESMGCAPSEKAIFACNLANGKRLAVCSTGAGRAEYRYGDDEPELVLGGGELGIVGYSGGGEAQIAFANREYRYVVFSRMVRTNFAADEPNYPAMSDGVVILRGNEFLDLQLCNDPQVLPVQYDVAENVWVQHGDLLTDETIRADP